MGAAAAHVRRIHKQVSPVCKSGCASQRQRSLTQAQSKQRQNPAGYASCRQKRALLLDRTQVLEEHYQLRFFGANAGALVAPQAPPRRSAPFYCFGENRCARMIPTLPAEMLPSVSSANKAHTLAHGCLSASLTVLMSCTGWDIATDLNSPIRLHTTSPV